MPKTGFLVSGESFVWSHKGLLKVKELKAGDFLLGIDENGKACWSALPTKVRKYGKDRLFRITTDGSEVLVSGTGEVFTINGLMKASNLIEGEIIETFNIPIKVRELLENKNPIYVDSSIGSIKINGGMSYLLGTQIRSRKRANKIIIDRLNPAHARSLAKLCSETLRQQHIKNKVYCVRWGSKIRIDSPVLAELCTGISENNIPRDIRESPATILREFLCGVLDVILYQNKIGTPPTYLITLAEQDELRRFIFNVLRLFGVIPVKTYVVHSTGRMYMKSFINTSDLSKLGLKFIRSKEVVKEKKSSVKPISYSTVREITEFQDVVFYLPEPRLHWSPVVDLIPLHRHAI